MKISVRERKILIVGAVVLVVSGAVYFGDRLLPGRSAQAADLEAKKRTLAHDIQSHPIEGKTHIGGLLEARPGALVALRRYRQLDRAEHARPQRRENVAAHGVDVQRKEIQRETKLQDNLVKITVRIETSCGLDQLIQLLAAVENYEKFLTVDTLNITAFRIQKRFDIRPSLTIAAFILVPEAKPPEKVANN